MSTHKDCPSFVVAYIPTEQPVTLEVDDESAFGVGNWQVDTDKETGRLDRYDDLEVALERVKYIREKGGEAALLVIIE